MVAIAAIKEAEPVVVNLHGVSWRFYEELLKGLGERRMFVTYDKGNLEIMSPLPIHERYKETITYWIHVIAEEKQINIVPGGSSTFKDRTLEKGIEPDACFWIANQEAVTDKDEIDLRKDPPPDLAIEINHTSSSINRERIYAALRIPELWRYDGESLRVSILKRGVYVSARKSPSFPFLPLDEFKKFLKKPAGLQRIDWVARFRAWVREL